MSPAVLSLLALLTAIVLSIASHINVGLVAIALAFVIGVYASGLRVEDVLAGFPSALFITLVGVTLLFGLAHANGTLRLLADRAVRLCRGNAAVLPLLFFALAFLISTVGPGAIASTALVAPMAMAIAARAGVSTLLTAVMIGTGANAGNLSPISSVGIIVNSLMARIGLGGHEWRVWAANFVVHVAVALAAYAAFRGWRPRPPRSPALAARSVAEGAAAGADSAGALERRHWLTIGVTTLWIVAVVLFRVHVGLSAFAAATVLVLLAAADEREAFREVPWGVIVMVTGVTLLIAILERTGGLELFTAMLARLATPATVNGVIAFVTGLVSTYSSTSGVVLPAFLPTVPGLVREVNGGDPLAVALSVNIGASLVDVSPLSTIGALCVAAVPDPERARSLFRKLMIWGFSMTVVGALLAQLLAGLFARA